MCTNVELTTTAYDWDEAKCCIMSRLALRGPALRWVEMLGNNFTWEYFKTQLVERYGEKPEEIMDKLRCRVQGQNETVGSYTDDYFSLLTRAAATDNPIPDKMQKSGYIEGLLPRLRDTLIIQNPATIMEASQAARSLEFQVQRLRGDKNSLFNFMQVGRNEASRPQFRQPNHNYQNSQQGFHNNAQRNSNYRNNNYQHPPAGNFNPRQQPNYSRQLPRKAPTADIDQLAKQMNDMQIKLSQMESSEFNHFTLEGNFSDYPTGLQMEEEKDSSFSDWLSGLTMKPPSEQILYNDGYYEELNYYPEYPQEYQDYQGTREDNWSDTPFDQFLDTDHPMPDAPALAQRRPPRRAGFNIGNQVQQRQPAAGALPQRPTATRGFQPPPAARPPRQPAANARPRPQGEPL